MRRFTCKTLAVMILDLLLIAFAGGFALLVRFDFSFNAIPPIYGDTWLRYLPIQVAFFIAVFYITHLYQFVWRSISAPEVVQMLCIIAPTYAVYFVVTGFLGYNQPRSVYIIELFFGTMLLTGERCTLRLLAAFKGFLHVRSLSDDIPRIMLIGGGEAGRIMIRELRANRNAVGTICCVIDDNEEKWGKYIGGIPIVGGCDTIPCNVKKFAVSDIIFAIPTASLQRKKQILNLCKDTGCRIKILPPLLDVVDRENYFSSLKDVQVEDLLGRESVKLDLTSIQSFLGGKTILITGGGGSIGSELARQVAHYAPEKLIILDVYENNAYDIQQELLREYGEKLNLEVVIASVRDRTRIREVCLEEKPDIVIHAAAHKHVPLMEDCPAEAVKNNIFGTYNVVCAAEEADVKRFILISTDKAVNPTSFMGASKRFCEMLLQSRRGSNTEFCAVRFGNVLGSNGSVVPLFRKQIESGGPVTVTDRRIVRYFMTVPEAVQLVLEAGAMAKQNEIFILDMGEPVKILDLAENMIRLSGLKPYEDIQIEEIGLRPGEKLYEELLMNSETLSGTENSKIFVEQQQFISPEEIAKDMALLADALDEQASPEQLTELLRNMIPTYHSPEEVNGQAERVTAFAQ